jgi:chaperonin GroEL (HSP60 family)
MARHLSRDPFLFGAASAGPEPFCLVSVQVSILLRGANDYMLDEMERSLHDSLCIVKRTLESNTVGLSFSFFM